MLSCEQGIAVRSGSFCAQPYVRRLVEHEQTGCEPGQAGLIRASFGLSTTFEEIDLLVSALRAIAAGDFDELYERDPARGDFQPRGWAATSAALFQLAG